MIKSNGKIKDKCIFGNKNLKYVFTVAIIAFSWFSAVRRRFSDSRWDESERPFRVHSEPRRSRHVGGTGQSTPRHGVSAAHRSRSSAYGAPQRLSRVNCLFSTELRPKATCNFSGISNFHPIQSTSNGHLQTRISLRLRLTHLGWRRHRRHGKYYTRLFVFVVCVSRRVCARDRIVFFYAIFHRLGGLQTRTNRTLVLFQSSLFVIGSSVRVIRGLVETTLVRFFSVAVDHYSGHVFKNPTDLLVVLVSSCLPENRAILYTVIFTSAFIHCLHKCSIRWHVRLWLYHFFAFILIPIILLLPYIFEISYVHLFIIFIKYNLFY